MIQGDARKGPSDEEIIEAVKRLPHYFSNNAGLRETDVVSLIRKMFSEWGQPAPQVEASEEEIVAIAREILLNIKDGDDEPEDLPSIIGTIERLERRLLIELSNAKADAKIMAHAYLTDNRPPLRIVKHYFPDAEMPS